MFATTYDMKKFGSVLKKIRKSLDLSQNDIYKQVGISPETIRRMEKGQTIPKYDTIEILSYVYKQDLLKLLAKFKSDYRVYDIYSKVDYIITSNRHSRTNDMDDLINKLIAKEKEIKIINPNQLSQIIMFIKLLKTSESGTTASEDQYISKLFESLKITIPLFKIENFRNFNYNHLELRILLLISLYYKKIEEYEIVLELLHFIIEEMKNKEYLTREGKKVLIKTYCNLSYTYYSIEKFKESKNFAELGIELAVDNDTNCSLHLLYARRAVAKILLNRDDYLQDINNSISILDIRGMNELKKKYINIYTEKYNIDFGSISRD